MTEHQDDNPASLPALQALKSELTRAAICGTSTTMDAAGVMLEGAADLLAVGVGRKVAADRLLAIAAKWAREVEPGGQA